MIKHILTFALLLSAGLAAAQTALPPGVPAPPPPPAPAPVADPTAITPARLVELLTDLGYEPKEVSTDGKQDSYLITSEREGWKLPIGVSLSPDRSVLWVGATFEALSNPAAAAPSAWLKLLEATNQHQPIHFAINEQSRRVSLWLGFPNTHLDASFLREQLETFEDAVRTTHPYWKTEAFAGK
jgi:hypothetical protein